MRRSTTNRYFGAYEAYALDTREQNMLHRVAWQTKWITRGGFYFAERKLVRHARAFSDYRNAREKMLWRKVEILAGAWHKARLQPDNIFNFADCLARRNA